MSEGRQRDMRAEGLKFAILITTFVVASALMALHLPA